MSETLPQPHYNQPLIDYADQIATEPYMPTADAGRMQTEVPDMDTRQHVDHRRAEIDNSFEHAQNSQQWKEKLSNPGRFVKIGRRLLNAVGVQSPGQQAIEYHEGAIGNYNELTGREGTDIAAVTTEDHDAARENIVAEEVEQGGITTKTYQERVEESQVPHRGKSDKELAIAHGVAQLDQVRAISQYNSIENVRERIDAEVAAARTRALERGELLSVEEHLKIRTGILMGAMALDNALEGALHRVRFDSDDTVVATPQK